eukprot:61037_1
MSHFQQQQIVKQGWLQKQSRYLKTWRRRWAVLADSKLYTFTEENHHSDPTEIIDLKIFPYVTPSQGLTGADTMFIVSNNKSQYSFIASSQHERYSWITAMAYWIECSNTIVTIDNLVQFLTPPSEYIQMKWHHVANAIRHELYDKIANTFLEATSNGKSVNDILNTLQNKTRIDANECEYIRNLIQRAMNFYYPRKVHQNYNNTNEADINDTSALSNDNITQQVNITTLCDIYNVHNCWLFMNCNFHHYKEHENSKIVKFNLYPAYIIDDDMYAIFNYFNAASYLVYKIRQMKDNFTLKITIIPNKVVSIYDENMMWVFEETMENLNPVYSIAKSGDMLYIKNVLEKKVNNSQTTNNILIVVDRRDNTCDNIFIIDKNINTFDALDKNYCISLLFTINNEDNIVHCHLIYGSQEKSKLRFYPEIITRIMPRIFRRHDNCENMDKLYHDSYKHGFAVDLHDPIFNKFYKMITKYEHVSVNYNRNVINEKDTEKKQGLEQYSYKDIEQQQKCELNEKLEIDDCPYITFIIHSLNLLKNIDINSQMVDWKQFNLPRLIKCYDHIISVHSFCLKSEERLRLQNHIRLMVGNCTFNTNCAFMKKHATRKREGKPKLNMNMNADTHMNTCQEILTACLISLHCYLLHDGNKLYRLERNTNANKARFRF